MIDFIKADNRGTFFIIFRRFMTFADCNTFFSNEFMCSLLINESFPFIRKPKFRMLIDSASRLSHVVASVAAIFVASAPSHQFRHASFVPWSSSCQLHWKPNFRVPIDFAPRLSHVVDSVAAIFRRASSVASSPTPLRQLCDSASYVSFWRCFSSSPPFLSYLYFYFVLYICTCFCR